MRDYPCRIFYALLLYALTGEDIQRFLCGGNKAWFWRHKGKRLIPPSRLFSGILCFMPAYRRHFLFDLALNKGG
jgi:hypothetical protein